MRPAILAACLLAASCGEPDPPRFIGLEIWESTFDPVRDDYVLQRRIDPQADGSYMLRRDLLHMARVTVEQSGGPDRCLFKPFNASWTPPSRSYDCKPEVPKGLVTIDVPFATWSGDIARAPEHFVTVQLYEMDAVLRELIAIHETHRYAVTFA